ncbi:MAG: hypothetical protein HY744_15190 [Deltaproteobacteria bacterium]|nr:hypothetical protein [Deltaproteobacteria bacterium]
MTSLAVDGLVDARPMTLGDRTVLLCTSRWVRADGNLTGGELVAVALGSEGPSRGGVVPLDRVDARGGGQVSSRTGSVEVSGEVVRFAGAERLVDRATGAEIESRPVAERYRIAADGRVTVEPAAPKDK